jgi:MFS family permease
MALATDRYSVATGADVISADTLNTAVATGIITAEQSEKLYALELLGPDGDETVEAASDENLRLIGGGNDLFVTVGTILVTAGFYFVASTYLPGEPLWLAGVLALFAWGVAEIVTRQHRMKLSSTVLSLFFMVAVVAVLGLVTNTRYTIAMPESIWQLLALRQIVGPAGYLFLGGAILAAALYFWRFRVPILAGIIAIAATLLAFLQTALFLYDGVTAGTVTPPTLKEVPQLLRAALYMPLICGLVVFGIAVALDLYDRERKKIWSDCAFWLHVVSAPMLVHPLFIMATGQDVVFGRIEPDTNATLMLALLIGGFVYVALAIDRRSLLVPTLAYFGSLGIYYLVNSTANTTGIPPFALILLAVGALIIFFGAGWQRIRRLVIKPTLPATIVNRLPPIRA